ncbi:CRISPR-associated endonuclease Cas3'' [Haloparvum sedimenti]|uniref:CRISPR-associated endonuclease Cas3'' n=1 Tax=Haloparvum sedimenti TaxID=1678448 RepID=UPI000B26D441|nr:CRISPR-associated endonuclease Cas3'' [Haloparvum sedimenti]
MTELDIDSPPSHLRTADGEAVPLDVHLADVAERVEAVTSDAATTAGGSRVDEIGRRVAWIHDIGKLTTWFQEHLHAAEGAPPVDGPSHHAPLGALVAYYALDVAGFGDDDPLVGFLAVAKHHGRLPDTAGYVRRAAADFDAGPLRRLFRVEAFEQIGNIDENQQEVADALIHRATGGAGSWVEFCEWAERARDRGQILDIAEHVLGGPGLALEAPDLLEAGFYDGCLQVWSSLVLADKTSARHLTQTVDLPLAAYEGTTPRRTAIDAKIRSLHRDADREGIDDRTRTLNEKRERARRAARSRARTFAESDRAVATLTLPTGLGKTLTGLDAGLTVLDHKPGNGRLVYGLPFTSIIDQVADVSEEVFDSDRVESDVLTVDHHLSETSVPLPDAVTESEETPDDSLADAESVLGESWRSGMVVTTFVQLFESLAGPANVESMKLPSLYDSVIVLDEPQALPHRWWELVSRLIQLLIEEYDATVIAMTATQPKLLDDEGDEPVELVPDTESYYEGLDRVRFDLHRSVEAALDGDPEPVGYDDAATRIADAATEGSSVLSICNTIDSARELAESVVEYADPIVVNEEYDQLLSGADRDEESGETTPAETIARALDGRSDDRPLFVHLTTRHRPVDRQHLIDVAVRLTERDLPVIFVSTQLVEAGVDISFDRVFRDFAPLDGLVQAAGRCNRSFDRDTGLVTVWALEPPADRERTPSAAVYDYGGNSLTKLTARALADVYEGRPMAEYAVTRTAVESYFEKLDERGVGNPEYVEYVEKANAETLGRLSLIDQRPAAEVVVTRTPAETAHVEELKRAYREYDWETVERKQRLLKPQQVSVPMYDNEAEETFAHCDPIHERDGRLHVETHTGRFDEYFDAVEGVVTPDDTVEARLL